MHLRPGLQLHRASCASAITFIDGDRGRLLYRGYPIEDIAEHGDMADCAHLLLRGTLPTRKQQRDFQQEVRGHRLVPSTSSPPSRDLTTTRTPWPSSSPSSAPSAPSTTTTTTTGTRPSAISRGCGAWGRWRRSPRVLVQDGARATIVYPRDDLNLAQNFMYMMFALPTRPYDLDPVACRCLEVILMLHADHEQNAAPARCESRDPRRRIHSRASPPGLLRCGTPRTAAPTKPCSRCSRRLGRWTGSPECVARAKSKTDPFRLMGFGHRVYKQMDPRARLMRDMCHKLLDHLKIKDPLLDLAMELEKVALSDDYFISRKLYPNVDFYSGICFRALGIPREMFTVIFAVGRSVGWIAQWIEMAGEEVSRISRPRQMYSCPGGPLRSPQRTQARGRG